MHDAFEAEPLLSKLPLQIESIACNNDNILLGTKQGHLLVFEIKYADGEPKVELSRAYKAFSKKPVIQLEVVTEYHIVICITDTVVMVHDLSVFAPITTLNKTRGASLFAIDIQKQSVPGEVNYSLKMCVANRRRLQLFYWKNREFHELQPDVVVSDVPRALCWCAGNICLGFKRDYHILQVQTGSIHEVFTTGSSLTPSITRLGDDRLALGRDEMTIIVDSSGTQTEKTALTWSDIPIVSAHQPPFIISVLDKYVEVRTINPRVLIQSIDLTRPRFLTHGSNGELYVASASSLWLLTPTPLSAQIKQLVLNKQYELALHMADLTDDADAEKQKRITKIKNLFAFDLFQRSEFKRSLDQFSELGTDPTHVIGLYPELLPLNFREKLEYPERLTPLRGNLEEALLALIDYLTEQRRVLLNDPSTKVETSPIMESNSTMTSRKQLSQVIDTTLLKCYLKTNDALVASLLRLPDNNCHVEECEKVLKSAQKYHELVILYERKAFHEKALDLLLRESQQPTSPLRGVAQTVQYLQRLGPENMALILEYSLWVLQADPDEGLKIFTEDTQEVEMLPRDKVIEHLTRVTPELVIPYLTHIIDVWDDDTQEIHQTLATLYKSKIDNLLQRQRDNLHAMAKDEVAELSETRKRFVAFLETSTRYLPDRLLAHMQFEDFFEERAIILGRLGRHKQALAIYIHIMGDSQRAEAYCVKNYDPHEKSKQNVFASLLELLLSPPEPAVLGVLSHLVRHKEPNLQAALRLLHVHSKEIDTAEALRILPAGTEIKDVVNYLSSVLDSRGKRKKRNQVLKGLYSAERLQVQEARITLETNSCNIGTVTICDVCRKHIGNSAFARNPGGSIVHYYCAKDAKTISD